MKTRIQNKFNILLSGLLLLVLPITFLLPTCYTAPAYAAKEDSAAILQQQAETLARTESTIAKGSVTWEKIKPSIESYLGTPYVWGGKTPKGWDCSGFVWWILHKYYNVTAKGEGTSHLMSHFNSSAYRVYDSRTQGINYSAAVSKGIVHPGDIIVFLNSSGVDVHTAIAGDGTYIYHAWSEYYDTCKTKFEKVWAEDGINHRGLKADPHTPSHLNERSRGYETSTYGTGTYANFVIFRGLPQGGIINLVKSSSAPHVTGRNPHYSLKGAVYQLHNSQKKLVATLTTDEHGRAKTGRLPYGIYTLKEIKASPGYALDTRTYTVKLSANDPVVDGMHHHTVSVKEKPQLYRENVRVLLSIHKLDSETKSQSPQGGTTLEGAVFEVNYYAIAAVKDVKALEGLKPHKTWKVSTNAEGTAIVPSLHQDETSLYGIPLGVLTIQEVSAPQGYLINNKKILVNLTRNGQETTIPFKQPFKISDDVIRGDFMMIKSDENEQLLEGAVFTVTSEATGHYLTLTTDKNGFASTEGMTLLPPEEKPAAPEALPEEQPNDAPETDSESKSEVKPEVKPETKPEMNPITETKTKGDSETSLNPEQTLKPDSTVDIQQIDRKGSTRGALPYGTYIVHEEMPPEGYLPIEDFKITIDRDQQFVFVRLEDKKIPEPESEPEPEPKPDFKPEPENESTPKPESKPESMPKSKPKTEPKPLFSLPKTGDTLPSFVGSLIVQITSLRA